MGEATAFVFLPVLLSGAQLSMVYALNPGQRRWDRFCGLWGRVRSKSPSTEWATHIGYTDLSHSGVDGGGGGPDLLLIRLQAGF